MKATVKISFVGAGGIARTHAAALQRLEGARMAGVYDVSAARAEELAASCGAAAYADLDACIEAGDAVYILTPPSTHRDIAARAAAAGKPIFLEKPLAATAEDGEAIAQACERAGVVAMVNFNMRYRPAYRKLKELLDSGELGDVVSLWSHRMDDAGEGRSWRTDPKLLCGMTIESLSHDIDMFRWLNGDIRTVCAHVGNTRADLPGFDNNASVLLTAANGRPALIQASLSSHLSFNSRGIVGTRGTAMISGTGIWNFDRLRYRTAEMAEVREEALDDPLDVRSYAETGSHFVHCIRSGTQPDVSVQDGLAALRITLAIHRSHREGSVIPV